MKNLDIAHFVDLHPQFKRELEHLNNNPADQRPENIALTHAMCNKKRRDGHAEMDLLAKEKLEENIRSIDPSSLSESEREKNTDMDELTDVQVNIVINKIVERYLDEKLPEGSKFNIPYGKALKSIHYLVIQETGGRGSEPAVRRSLNAFCSECAKWEDYKEGRGLHMIRKR